MVSLSRQMFSCGRVNTNCWEVLLKVKKDMLLDAPIPWRAAEATRAAHRVHEVVRDVDARERPRQALTREHVALACVPLARAAAAECAHTFTAFQQFVDKL